MISSSWRPAPAICEQHGGPVVVALLLSGLVSPFRLESLTFFSSALNCILSVCSTVHTSVILVRVLERPLFIHIPCIITTLILVTVQNIASLLRVRDRHQDTIRLVQSSAALDSTLHYSPRYIKIWLSRNIDWEEGLSHSFVIPCGFKSKQRNVCQELYLYSMCPATLGTRPQPGSLPITDTAGRPIVVSSSVTTSFPIDSTILRQDHGELI